MGKYVIKDKNSESYLVIDNFLQKWVLVHSIEDYTWNNAFCAVFEDNGLKNDIKKLNKKYNNDYYDFEKKYIN